MAYDSENYVVTDLPQPPTLSPEVRETLVKARKLLAKGWCRHQRHKVVPGFLGFGAKHEYCIVGALETVCQKKSWATYSEASEALSTELSKKRTNCYLPHFNDNSNQAVVLKLFDDTLREQS